MNSLTSHWIGVANIASNFIYASVLTLCALTGTVWDSFLVWFLYANWEWNYKKQVWWDECLFGRSRWSSNGWWTRRFAYSCWSCAGKPRGCLIKLAVKLSKLLRASLLLLLFLLFISCFHFYLQNGHVVFTMLCMSGGCWQFSSWSPAGA